MNRARAGKSWDVIVALVLATWIVLAAAGSVALARAVRAREHAPVVLPEALAAPQPPTAPALLRVVAPVPPVAPVAEGAAAA